MNEWNDSVKMGEQGEDALPDMQEFFFDIWDMEQVKHSIAEHIEGQLEEWIDEGWDEDAFVSDYNEAYTACWWEQLIEWMRIGTDIKVGDLMVSGRHDDSIIMLMSHPEHYDDECWMLNGKLLSTFELISDDVEYWYEC